MRFTYELFDESGAVQTGDRFVVEENARYTLRVTPNAAALDADFDILADNRLIDFEFLQIIGGGLSLGDQRALEGAAGDRREFVEIAEENVLFGIRNAVGPFQPSSPRDYDLFIRDDVFLGDWEIDVELAISGLFRVSTTNLNPPATFVEGGARGIFDNIVLEVRDNDLWGTAALETARRERVEANRASLESLERLELELNDLFELSRIADANVDRFANEFLREALGLTITAAAGVLSLGAAPAAALALSAAGVTLDFVDLAIDARAPGAGARLIEVANTTAGFADLNFNAIALSTELPLAEANFIKAFGRLTALADVAATTAAALDLAQAVSVRSFLRDAFETTAVTFDAQRDLLFDLQSGLLNFALYYGEGVRTGAHNPAILDNIIVSGDLISRFYTPDDNPFMLADRIPDEEEPRIVITDGDDVILGTDEGERFAALIGDDSLSGAGGDDTLLGGSGADTVFGGEGRDSLEGGDGEDVLSGDGDRDRISGGRDRDTIFGGDGDDVLRGGTGGDRLRGGDGADTARGQGGADRLFGQTGDDTLIGANGADTLKGGAGEDRLVGGGAADRLFGGLGDDTLIGAAGEDRLLGGAGDDVLTGGTGVDRFIFRANGGDDVVLDFDAGREQLRIQSGADRFEDLTIIQSGTDVVIAFTGSTITLEGVRATDVSEVDFLF